MKKAIIFISVLSLASTAPAQGFRAQFARSLATSFWGHTKPMYVLGTAYALRGGALSSPFPDKLPEKFDCAKDLANYWFHYYSGPKWQTDDKGRIKNHQDEWQSWLFAQCRKQHSADELYQKNFQYTHQRHNSCVNELARVPLTYAHGCKHNAFDMTCSNCKPYAEAFSKKYAECNRWALTGKTLSDNAADTNNKN